MTIEIETIISLIIAIFSVMLILVTFSALRSQKGIALDIGIVVPIAAILLLSFPFLPPFLSNDIDEHKHSDSSLSISSTPHEDMKSELSPEITKTIYDIYYMPAYTPYATSYFYNILSPVEYKNKKKQHKIKNIIGFSQQKNMKSLIKRRGFIHQQARGSGYAWFEGRNHRDSIRAYGAKMTERPH